MNIDNLSLAKMIEEEIELIPLMSHEEERKLQKHELPDELPILPLRNTVIFPGVVVPISAGRDKSIRLLSEAFKKDKIIGVVSQKSSKDDDPGIDQVYMIGTVAKIMRLIKMPDGNTTAILQGVKRFEITDFLQTEPYHKAKINYLKEKAPSSRNKEFPVVIDNIKDLAHRIIEENPMMPSEAASAIRSIESDTFLINFVSSNLSLDVSEKQNLLEIEDIKVRAMEVLGLMTLELQRLELKNDIQTKVRKDLDQQQREYFLNQQIRTIQEELGGNSIENDVEEMRLKAQDKKWDIETRKHFDKELTRFGRLNPQMPEHSIQRNYLEFMLELPWGEYSDSKFDLKKAQKVLDEDHYGLEDVKERIIEHLAVLKLKGDMKSPIICLYGPPGVGKTSLGKSIAAALDRKYVRMSLGGLHDESEIRGHRKTYIGAMPGRVMQSIKKAETSNPVFVLDEIDKMGKSAHGDPTSAMLEVLDPEQNTSFYDNYLEQGFDLSKVFFIATANNISNIPAPLRDRMEMIDISGYTIEEKVEIAKRHLLPKQLGEHGIKAKDLQIGKREFEFIVDGYTRESGVRKLDQLLAKLVRNTAKFIALEQEYQTKLTRERIIEVLGPSHERERYENNNKLGVVIGLAWTKVGGDILYIESILSQGKGNLSITGNLGTVMKESAQIALEYIKAHAGKLGIPYEKIEKSNVHIHVPEGATPKDGPSAGITMLTSLVSSFTQKKVKPRIAMTGEITLRGRVLPVGGIKEKILAAKRANIKEIILSEDNRNDVEKVKQEYLQGLTFHYVREIDDVLKIALIK